MSSISSGTTLTTALVQTADTSGVLQLQTNGGTTAVTIDINQNFGLGITPSAWGGTYKALDISTYTSVYGASGNTSGFSQNAYYNGTNWIYRNTNAASNYIQSGGTHVWQTASSGTAGTAITFTQAMTLDASANLLVGTTSNLSSRVGIQGASSTSSDYAINCQNSSASVLFGTRNDGLFFTGTATNAPYNFSASGKTMIVNSSGQIGSLVSLRIAKTNINPAPVASFINQLEIVTFNYRKKDESGNYTEEFDSELNWGVIADDALSVAPDFVSHNSNGEMDGFHYDRMVAPLIKYVQELSAQVTTLQTQVTALKG